MLCDQVQVKLLLFSCLFPWDLLSSNWSLWLEQGKQPGRQKLLPKWHKQLGEGGQSRRAELQLRACKGWCPYSSLWEGS